MKKEEVYKLIKYNGEYNDEVKKRLKSLLKKYHPDHQGNEDIFKVINEVKKELEQKKNYKKVFLHEKNNSSSINYYFQRLTILEKEKDNLKEEINVLHKKIKNNMNEYSILYDENINKDNLINNNKQTINNIRRFKKRYYIYMISLFIFSLLSIFKNKIYVIPFIILILILSIDLGYSYVKLQKIVETTFEYINNNYQISQKLTKLLKTKNNYKRNLIQLEQKINLIENDIRFYNNEIKKSSVKN